MTRAFIVKLDVQGELLADAAVDIEEALDRAGLPVLSVVPWKGHGVIAPETVPVTPTGPLPPPIR